MKRLQKIIQTLIKNKITTNFKQNKIQIYFGINNNK